MGYFDPKANSLELSTWFDASVVCAKRVIKYDCAEHRNVSFPVGVIEHVYAR